MNECAQCGRHYFGDEYWKTCSEACEQRYLAYVKASEAEDDDS